MKTSLGIILLLTLCTSCMWTDRPMGLAALEAYARMPEHGLVRGRTVNGITTTVRLQPPAIGALREHASMGPTGRADSSFNELLERHGQQLCFVLNLAPDSVHFNGDVMYAGVRNVNEFKEQAYALNFSWEERVELHCGAATYHPVLSTLENTYGLSKDRNVVLVFAPTAAMDNDFFGSETLELVVDDDQLGTGTQHFKFQRADLRNVPRPTI